MCVLLVYLRRLSYFRWITDRLCVMQVYAQVQLLFKDAPDLLGEFKKFLPELMNASGMDASFAGIMPATVSGSSGPWPPEPVASSSAVSKGGVPPSRRRKREPVPKETPQSKSEQARVSPSLAVVELT